MCTPPQLSPLAHIPSLGRGNDKQALDLIKNKASTEGGSLDAYFEKQESQAKLDLGWKVYPRQNGAFAEEQLMFLNEKFPTNFK
jgi:hypothetical protein